MPKAHNYLNFAGDTEEAFEFYRSVFGGEFTNVVRFRDFGGEGVPEKDLDKIMHIGLKIGGEDMIMATDTLESQGRELKMGNNNYIYLEADNAENARELYDGLSRGGQIEMKLEPVPWAELYSSFIDKFGVQWMVSYTGNVQFGG